MAVRVKEIIENPYEKIARDILDRLALLLGTESPVRTPTIKLFNFSKYRDLGALYSFPLEHIDIFNATDGKNPTDEEALKVRHETVHHFQKATGFTDRVWSFASSTRPYTSGTGSLVSSIIGNVFLEAGSYFSELESSIEYTENGKAIAHRLLNAFSSGEPILGDQIALLRATLLSIKEADIFKLAETSLHLQFPNSYAHLPGIQVASKVGSPLGTRFASLVAIAKDLDPIATIKILFSDPEQILSTIKGVDEETLRRFERTMRDFIQQEQSGKLAVLQRK